MFHFLVRRFIGAIFVVMGVSFITFVIGYFTPIDPIRQMMGQHYTYASWLVLRHQYGLDLPWYQQYYNFLVHFAHFDLRSIHSQDRLVLDILKDGVPISAELASWGLALTLLLGIPAGVISAVKANTWIDTGNMILALILYALPSFIIAVFAQVIIVWLNVHTGSSWPVANWGTPWHYTWSDLQYKIVPIVVYAGAGYAYFARLARTSMLEVLNQDYIRTARAKGLVEHVVIYTHALRNALVPLITSIGLAIGLLIVGSLFIERIFNIQGIAQITINAVIGGDYPVIQVTAMLSALGIVLGNLLSDVLYTIVDPRIKLS